MSTRLPDERDFEAQGCLDAQCAWEHFGGLDLQQAIERFDERPEIYQEDFMFMGGRAFAFYFPVIDQFLRKTITLSPEERGDRQSWILPQCIRHQFMGQSLAYVMARKQEVLELCEFMLQHLSFFADDWDDPAEIQQKWEKLRQHVRECF